MKPTEREAARWFRPWRGRTFVGSTPSGLGGRVGFAIRSPAPAGLRLLTVGPYRGLPRSYSNFAFPVSNFQFAIGQRETVSGTVFFQAAGRLHPHAVPPAAEWRAGPSTAK